MYLSRHRIGFLIDVLYHHALPLRFIDGVECSSLGYAVKVSYQTRGMLHHVSVTPQKAVWPIVWRQDYLLISFMEAAPNTSTGLLCAIAHIDLCMGWKFAISVMSGRSDFSSTTHSGCHEVETTSHATNEHPIAVLICSENRFHKPIHHSWSVCTADKAMAREGHRLCSACIFVVHH